MNFAKMSRLISCVWCGESIRFYGLHRHLTKKCAHAPRLKANEGYCTICQQAKALTDLYPNTHGCKPCRIAQGREWRIRNTDVVRLTPPLLRPGGWKLRPCPHCGEQFNYKQMLTHKPRCALRPLVIAGHPPDRTPDTALRNMAALQQESANGKERRDRSRLLNFQYGIDADAYDRMYAAQSGACAICKKPPYGEGRGAGCLHVDHDHASGKVRGLLCTNCNVAIGKFRDNPALLIAALAYLAAYCPVDVVT